MINTNRSILILDDDESFRQLVSTLLKNRGLEVVEASCGEQASSLFASHKPILAIVDYRLPDTDGMTWITKIKESGNKCPVVFVSHSWCDPKTFSWLRNIVKASLILQKPIVPELFLEQIEDLLPHHLLKEADANRESAQQRSEKLAKIKTSYVPKLTQAWEELTQSIFIAQKDSEDSSALARATEVAHKLAGTAGSVGFKRVGDIAAKVQNLLTRLDPSDALQQIIWAEIFRTLAEGETAVRDSVRACEATAQNDDSIPASQILLYGKEDTYREIIANLKTVVPVKVEVSDKLPALTQRIKSSSFDAVIFDLSMGDSNQIFQTAREFRSLPGYESLPFGFISKKSLGSISTSSQVAAEVDLIYAGCTVLISETPNKQELEQTCDKLLSFKQSNKPRVLTVDDDEILTKFIASILTEEGIAVSVLNKPVEIMQVLEQLKPDLVLLDVIMPGLSGYDVCRRLRNNDKWQDLPVIFLTSKNDQAGRAAAFRAGGTDFLSKPILAEELMIRINNQLARIRAKPIMERDELVLGMMNGENFINIADRFLKQAKDQYLPITFSLLSIDNFTDINLEHGWASAQEVLSALNKLLRCRFRAEDLKGCLGEDLFALAFPKEKVKIISMVMAKLLQEFKSMKFIDKNGAEFRASFSFGLAEYPSDGLDLSILLDAANRTQLNKRAPSNKVAV